MKKVKMRTLPSGKKVPALIDFAFLHEAEYMYWITMMRIFRRMRNYPRFAEKQKEIDQAIAYCEEMLTMIVFFVAGDKMKMKEKTEKRTEISAVGVNLGHWVEELAMGDEALVWEAGFPLRKEKHEVKHDLVPPKNLDVVNKKTKSGEAEATWDKVVGMAWAKLEWWLETDKAVRGDAMSKTGKCTVKVEKVGVIYVFRVCSIDEDGNQSDWSEETSIVIS